jgi:23S rRNA (cytosine1962-C5)-methyltransferase
MNDKLTMFRNRLVKVYRHVQKLAQRRQVSCYRIYDHDLPEFPLCIERYGNKVQVTEYKRHHHLDEAAYEEWLSGSLAVIGEVLETEAAGIFLKQRRRKEDRLDQYEKLDQSENFFEVEEQGLKFLINLTNYLDTGLFTDHRITRQMVREEAAGKKVLNLFCYTGSFSVYAAAGGAAGVTSIDLSNTYINWARRNMENNGLYDQKKHHFIKADVLQYIEQLPASHFDLVILDPPTFSNSKMMKDFFDVQQHHAALINRLLQKMTRGGVMYFSNNYTKFEIDAAAIAAQSIKDITGATTPFDYEKKLKRACFRMVK